MSEADLRAAIEGPARQVGLLLEPGLVDLLVREVEGEPGALPLLSHALARDVATARGPHPHRRRLPADRWDQRLGRPVGRGGLRPSPRRPAATAARPAAAPGRRPPPRANRYAAGSRAAPSPPTPNTNGSSNCSCGPGWSPATTTPSSSPTSPSPGRGRACAAGSTTTSRANASCATSPSPPTPGTTMGRPDSELYRGVRLAQALDWQTSADPDLTPAERAFLDTSAERERAEAETTEQQLRHQTRQNRRLRASARRSRRAARRRVRRRPARRAAGEPGRPRARSPPTPAGSVPRLCSPRTSTSRCCSRWRGCVSTTRSTPGPTCWRHCPGAPS